jgi:hypothetical protein
MKALTWKAMLATLNPSHVFAALAGFAEELAMNGNGRHRNKSALTERGRNMSPQPALTPEDQQLNNFGKSIYAQNSRPTAQTRL